MAQQSRNSIPAGAARPEHRRHTSGWPAEADRFDNRSTAGRALGAVLADQIDPGRQRPLVLAVPRGGVVVAGEIAAAIDADLDVMVAIPIGLPWRPGVTVGAVAGSDTAVLDHDALAVAGSTPADTTPIVQRCRAGLRARQDRYRGDRPPAPVAGRTVVVIDDGLSPGIVTRAVVRAVRAADPARLVYGAPVCAAESADLLHADADAVVHLHSPRVFPALGLWYRDMTPVTDHDVTTLLAQIWGAPTTTTVG